MPLLSVIVPVYNEAKTIRQILDKVNSVPIDKEIVIVNDGSCDGTDKILRDIHFDNLKVIHHTSNRGKGSAVLTGLSHASGEFVIIQDADLEYDPNEYPRLMKEAQSDNVDLVLGARFTKGYHGLLIPRLGNRFLTQLMNLLFGCRLNDFLTCYKVLRRDTLMALELESRNFNIETEIVAKALKHKFKIKEVAISYNPRNYAEGKKIRWLDGVKAVLKIFKYRFFDHK